MLAKCMKIIHVLVSQDMKTVLVMILKGSYETHTTWIVLEFEWAIFKALKVL